MKIILAGTPDITIPAFRKIINEFDVVAIVTNPDRKSGRGMKLNQSAVAKLAAKFYIKVFKPNKISEIYDELKTIEFDLLLSFAFGQLIPDNILALGTMKPLNIHGSLLPKYRGSAPIHHAILNGDKEIGITLMEMIKKMDAGNMYFKASTKINEFTTVGDGFKIVSELAEKNIIEWLYNAKSIDPEPQGENFTLAPKITKASAQLLENDSIETNLRKIRGMNPFPGAFVIKDKRIKIFDASINKKTNSVEIICTNGLLYANVFQEESKKITILD